MAYLKLLERSAVFAWSPAYYSNLYLAAGTNAQQVDSSFNTTSAIDLCYLDFKSDDAFQSIIKPTATGEAEHRFHQLTWAEIGGNLGTLIGGCENGSIVLYDPASKLVNSNDPSKPWLVKQSKRHTGAVRTLDLNSTQKHLLASGASNGDVFIFDLNRIEQPMTPGPRSSSETSSSVLSVGWNKRVEHILATLYPGYAFVWDLRRSDGPIMKLGDLGGGRGQWTALKWHPDSSTTLCLASGDDHYPVVQMWDVRFANAACAQLEGHQRGILSMDWCVKDSDLLATCGKDSKIYIWNPNNSQYLSEIPLATSSAGRVHSWPFEVQWSPRDPNLVAVASFDGRIAIYSLSGAVAGAPDFSTTSIAKTPKLAESFPGADFAFQPAAVQKMLQDRHQQQQNQLSHQPRVILPSPPKWMRNNCGARFAFGGKLISFSRPLSNQDSTEKLIFSVDICQVVTEQTVFERASELYTAINGDGSSLNLPVVAELCIRRSMQSSDLVEKCIWEFLQAHVQRSTRQRYIEIVAGSTDDANSLAEKVKTMCGISLSTTEDSDGIVNGSPAHDVAVGSIELQDEVEDENDSPSPWPVPISVDEKNQLELPISSQTREGLLCQLITRGKYSAAVELCIMDNKWTDALQLATLGNRGLYERTQQRYYEQLRDPISKFICLVTNERWDILIASASLRNSESWRQIFAILLNHVQSNDLAECLEQLGKKMESDMKNCRQWAPTCYIAAGLVDRLVENLSNKTGNDHLTADELHDIIEKATVLRLSLGGGSQRALDVGPVLAERLGRYVNLLIEQGCLTLALQLLDALPEDTDQHLMDLRYRIYQACSGFVPVGVRRPKAPFDIGRSSHSQYQQQQYQMAQRSRAPSLVPPAASMHTYGSGGFAQPQQSYNQQPPPPPASMAASHAPPVSAVKSTRSRYPSYASDGISYPSSSVVNSISPQFPSGPATTSYPGQSQQYASNVVAPSVYQQQQFSQPPIFQQPTQANPNPFRPSVPNMNMNPSATAVPQPILPPPPPGPATELQHRPWNDPPPLSPKKSAPAKKPDIPQPVTFPVLGAGTMPTMMDHVGVQYQSQIQPIHQQQQPITYQQPTAGYQQPSAQHSPAPQPAPTVPAEHEIIVNVLQRLADIAVAKAPNVQTRRRIEDSSQKLNSNLPSLLASAKLSKLTLTELHQLIDCIRAYDYNSALAMHARIVEGVDFSLIASFMPSVKVLIQSAAQFGVYYS